MFTQCCDSCVAEWQVQVARFVPANYTVERLQFCLHHFVKNEPGLLGKGFAVVKRKDPTWQHQGG
jgi:hypothetical protein